MCSQKNVKIRCVSPINIALVKYWGKEDEINIIPHNNSLSLTLDTEEMSTTTILEYSPEFEKTTFVLNGVKQPIKGRILDMLNIALLRFRRNLNNTELACRNIHFKIVSDNNFPTASGLASSASGLCALARCLCEFYHMNMTAEIASLARRGSGSACRSCLGGFVEWSSDKDSSCCISQIFSADHWRDLCVLICVVDNKQKSVGSTSGMQTTMQTSRLYQISRKITSQENMDKIKAAIRFKDFDKLAEIIMQESNQLHAFCMDSQPPIFYLNDSSKYIINEVNKINQEFGERVVAYTFDAGPNAFLFCKASHLETVKARFQIDIVQRLIVTRPGKGPSIEICNSME